MTECVRHERLGSLRETWSRLGELAVRGLQLTYADGRLPYTMRYVSSTAQPEGYSIRYALIALLGLGKGVSVVGEQGDLVRALWKRVEAADHSRLSPGDWGLGLWGRALHSGTGTAGGKWFECERAFSRLMAQAHGLDSVELAWLLLGADHAVVHGIDDGSASALAAASRKALLSLYNQEARLFYRHGRTGAWRGVSRRIACFANQIYPVMALAVHARTANCRDSLGVAWSVAEELCKLQGEYGQWWWLYDARDGGVVDGYPVYSVHQDGMAPMALYEAAAAHGGVVDDAIERSLSWIWGDNEINQRMVVDADGLILRDVHRRGIGRIARMFKGVVRCVGLRSGRQGGAEGKYEINAECRPYHLGWILYAAGLACARHGETKAASRRQGESVHA